MCLGLSLEGVLNVEALSATLDALVRRHAALRLRVLEEDDDIRQVVDTPVPVLIERRDFAPLRDGEKEAELQRVLQDDQMTRFDPHLGRLIRATLCRMADSRHVLVLVMDRLVADCWSLDILAEELVALYAAFADSTAPEALPDSDFVRYLDSQSVARAGERNLRAGEYWRSQLDGASTALSLRTVRAHESSAGRRATTHRVDMPPTTAARVHQIARETSTTVFMVFVAAALMMLMERSGEGDVVVGIPLSGRMTPAAQTLVGCLMKTVPLRIVCDPATSLAQLLTQVRSRLVKAMMYEDAPFDPWAEALRASPAARGDHRARVGLSHISGGVSGTRLASLDIDRFPIASPTLDLDLTISVMESGSDCRIYFEHTEVFDDEEIDGMAGHLLRVLDVVVSGRDTLIGRLGSPIESSRRIGWVRFRPKASSEDRRHLGGEPLRDRMNRSVAQSGVDDFHARASPELIRGLCHIWSTVLQVDDVGPDDDFFGLGGNSLLATQALARIRQHLGVDVPLHTIFDAPSPARLAAAIPSNGPVLSTKSTAPGPSTRVPLSLAQEQMWKLESAAAPPGLYNVTVQRFFTEAVDADLLQEALAVVVNRHEPLRTRFGEDETGCFQTVEPTVPVTLTRTELTATGDIARTEELQRRIGEENAAPFDLRVAPLWRALLFALRPDSGLLIVTFDHLVCDGPSAYVFVDELNAAYHALASGDSPQLGPLPIRYSEFAQAQRAWVSAGRLQDQTDYWEQKLAGMPLGPAIPFDHVPETPTRRIARSTFTIKTSAYDSVVSAARQTRSTPFVVAVAAVSAVCARRSARSDLMFSTTVSGRSDADVAGLIGMFSGMSRIRQDLSDDPSFEEVIHRSRDTVFGMLEHQDVPFMRIRGKVLPDFPRTGVELLASVPTEFVYFRIPARDASDTLPSDDIYFRGQLHPLSVTLLDDGNRLWGTLSYKLDWYDARSIESVQADICKVLEAVDVLMPIRLSAFPLSFG